MKIQEIAIGKIKPYKYNPRDNDDAVPLVMASIHEFGFKVPIVLDKNNTIVCGHTRYKAAKQLGLSKVPCVVADDLSEEQIKAFRLADNKVAEKAKWDRGLLDLELDGIFDIDMTVYDFDISDNEDEEIEIEKKSHRENTYGIYNLDLVDLERTTGFYQMPTLEKCLIIPTDLIGFNYMLSSTDTDKGIHCFVDDYQFERLWNSPHKYTDRISEFECFLTPDFSLYMDMPMSMKIWNIFRSRLIGQFFQDQGIDVIPTVSWAEKETFDFCFDGIAKGSVVATSTIGVKNNDFSMQIWRSGMDEMIKRIKPYAILVYGGEVEYDYKDIPVYYYENKVTERLKNAKG